MNASTRPEGPRRTRRYFVYAALGGALQCLGFAGFSWWPFAFVAFLPMFWLVDRGFGVRRVLLFGYVHGVVGYAGGYYWLVPTLERFSGYEGWPNWIFASVFWLYMGGQQALLYVLVRQLGRARVPLSVAAPAALLTLEYLYPTLFPAYLASGLHDVSVFVQIADLGGPMLVSAVVMLVNVGLYRLIFAAGISERRREIAVATAAVLATLAYGAFRIGEVSGRMQVAESLRVGTVQVDMGTFEKWDAPFEGHRRHLEQGAALLAREPELELMVWPESAYTFALPRDATNVQNPVLGDLQVPTLFGGLTRSDDAIYNTAILTDASGEVLGTYDKTHLLAFGEYMPFGDTFPILYEWSPNSGRFTPGGHLRPLVLPHDGVDVRVSVLVCYEDVLPGFTRDAVRAASPHLLANITNDAWFGDTQEPWVHLALAQFRAIEHHRSLVRSTNNGVSALIDPLGRVLALSPVAVRDEIAAELPLLDDDTVFTAFGQWPGPLALLVSVVAFLPRRRRA